MSEEKMTEYDAEGRVTGSKKIVRDTSIPTQRILVEKTGEGWKEEDAELKAKAELLDALTEATGTQLNELHSTDIFTGKTLDEMRQIDVLLRSKLEKTKRKASTGTVSLRGENPTEDIFDREYDETPEGAKQFASDLYRELVVTTDPVRKARLEDAIFTLGKKKMEISELPKKMVFDTSILESEARRALGDKFSHREYTRWLRLKLREVE